MSALEAPDNSAQPQGISRKSEAPPKPEPGSTTQKPGTQLGRWTLLKPLARGGMGEVYLATAGGIEGAERPAVVKIIRREHRKDSSFLARFFDEARIQAQLQHPGVAQVLEASTDSQGNPYVVLEHIEGRNLSEVRQRTSQLKMPMSWADAVAVAVSLAEALAHVHERTDAAGRALSIVHRDMSPQNVMVGYAGDVKLIDFGTARGENRRCQTVSGVVFAKPGYVAPEVANQNQPGPPADLYALGIILWELCMGRRFLTGDPSEHLSKVASGERQPQPVSSSINVPLELDTLIARLTAPRLEDRYHSAREALSDLVRVLSRAPSLADGERSVRGRIAHLMNRLYPSEPMRTRAEFARLLADRRHEEPPNPFLPESPQPANTAELLPGTRYRVISEIARSPMSVVFEAVHVDLERKVALKVLPKERCEDPRFEARFRREARALAQLRDPSMVTLHDFGVSQDGRPFYAMELLLGQTLQAHLASNTVPWTSALRFGIGVCKALEVAHEHGIVHRDVKPANVFLTSSGQIKLIDFGVAHDGDDEPDDEHSGALSINGTPAYMAPEQFGRGAVTPRADIYAIATVLYELLTGQLPFTAQTTMGLLEAKRKGALAPRRLRGSAPWPSILDKVLLQALDPSPAVRHASARRLREVLENIERRSRGGNLRKLTATAVGVTAAGSLLLGRRRPRTS
jgi:serine/threonine-protein kinase